MCFYCFELDDESKKLCTICTPYGIFQYQRTPMGVRISPWVVQSFMKDILHGLDMDMYIDDCSIFTRGTSDEHLALVDQVLKQLSDNGLKCNPLKCNWMVKETNFLEYWMTPTRVKPMKDKIDAILKMSHPTNQSQV